MHGLVLAVKIGASSEQQLIVTQLHKLVGFGSRSSGNACAFACVPHDALLPGVSRGPHRARPTLPAGPCPDHFPCSTFDATHLCSGDASTMHVPASATRSGV